MTRTRPVKATHLLANRAPFAMVPNSLFYDESLTPEAMLVVCYLISKPSDWTLQASDVSRVFGWGRDKTRDAMQRAQEAGWFTRHRFQEGRTWVTVTVSFQEGPLVPVPPIDSQGYQPWLEGAQWSVGYSPGSTGFQSTLGASTQNTSMNKERETKKEELQVPTKTAARPRRKPSWSPAEDDGLVGAWQGDEAQTSPVIPLRGARRKRTEPEPQTTPGTNSRDLAAYFSWKASDLGVPGHTNQAAVGKRLAVAVREGVPREALVAAVERFFGTKTYDVRSAVPIWKQFLAQLPTLAAKGAQRQAEATRDYGEIE